MLYQRSSWITNALNSDCTHYVLMLSHVRRGFRTLGGVPAGPQAGGQLLPRAQGFRVVVIKIKDVEAIGKFELAASAGASGSWGSASDREHYCRAATLTLSAFTQRRLSARDDAASNTNRDANMSTIHTTLPPREETLKLHDKHLAWAFSE
ncbi:hypothetical protein L210DRAFT_3502363 [Boletus edulis BED1]|uniref:Uncharacterized protein n=1 Tax=Boletus edulis BED1 TaxID=1328754 RepID=A0AAD4C193_BOLED|nr:hypothetical protein L210DRAFT_3502363 [Boletus edulis BED1]